MRGTLSVLAAVLLLVPADGRGEDAYKRVHQKALRSILDGAPADAIESLLAFEAEHPEDAETRFVLALAQARVGAMEDATTSARLAIERGLPPGRFHAEPRELLNATLREAVPLGGELVHGPMLGEVTHERARIWLRTATEANVRVTLQPTDGVARHAVVRTREEYGLATVALVGGLSASTTYRVTIVIDGAAPLARDEWTFTTARTPSAPGRTRIAFGGGAGFVPDHEHVWTTIGRLSPDALLLLGDNVYIDDPKRGAMQRYCYSRRQSRPEFRRLVAGRPVYSIWDDHDFGTNDCFGGPDYDRPSWKREVWEVFRRQWANPGYGGGVDRPGCWYGFSIGDVDFFMLDGRMVRTDPQIDDLVPTPSMLGPDQKRWLFEALARSTGGFKVLCSPVPWEFRTKGKSKDTWNGFRDEREEIFSFLERKKIDGVILLSADRHRSDIWRIPRPGGYDLIEFSSSRLTNQHVHKVMSDAVFSYNEKQSFGVVDFETGRDDPSITLRVVSIDGEEVFAYRGSRSSFEH